jgi:hypothetical protein
MQDARANVLRNLISDDIFMNPNFTGKMLDEHYSHPCTEIFPKTYLIYDYLNIKEILKNPMLTTHEIGVGNYFKLNSVLELSKLELLGDVLFSDFTQHVKLRGILMKSYMKLADYIPHALEKIVLEHFASIACQDTSCISKDIATPISEKLFLLLSGMGGLNEFNNFNEFFYNIRLLMNGIDNNFEKCGQASLVQSWQSVFFIILDKIKNPDLSYQNLIAGLHEVSGLSDEEKTIMILAFIRAGIENPRSFIISSIIRYFEHPKIYFENETCFLDEVMRYDCPAKITARYVQNDLELFSHHFSKGSKIWVSFRLANFHPDFFNDPFTFKLREKNPHLSLGFGPHFCIGKDLSFQMASMVIKHIIKYNYIFDKYSKNYRLEDSFVFRRYINPLYLRKIESLVS